MISGSHVVIFTQDAEADRAFFCDVLQLPSVDAGEGWLIFALPPSEVALHPADRSNAHQFYLLCDDLQVTMRALEEHGVRCETPVEESWGIRTEVPLPGGGRIGLYQPLHPRAQFAAGEASPAKGRET
jgi:catechol 2,3-dioxygenase-like lactoylglutathione lyase family enzyme